jgi:uncharacterized protein involved in exopolysaccharide biosynthesis
MTGGQNYQSVSRRPPDIEDYIEMVRRYRSWIIAPMFAGLVIAVVVGFLYPDTYVSYALLRIQPAQVSAELVPVVNYTSMAERLTQLQTEILSRGTLTEIIQMPGLDLYKKERTKLPTEDIIQEMKSKIHLIPVASNDRKYATAFQIQFSYTDKYKTQKVVAELVKRFIDSNEKAQKQAANLSVLFTTDEVKISKERIDEIEAKITDFKMKNNGRLPEQVAQNSQAMFQLQMQSYHYGETINRDQQDLTILQSELQSTRNEMNYLQGSLTTTVQGQSSSVVVNQQLIDIGNQITTRKANLAELMNTYGPNYPEIATERIKIDALEKQRAELESEDSSRPAPAAGASRKVTNPQVERQLQTYKNQYDSTQSKIVAKQSEIEDATRHRADLDKQIAVYQKRIDESPVNEQQLALLLGELNLAKQSYTEKVRKQEDSQTAVNLEAHRAGETLEQLDPPTLPDTPTEPKRWAWAGVGTLAGLILGLTLAAAKEVKNTSLKNLKDVRAYTSLPVLSSIPLLENALLLRRKRRLVWLAWSSALIVGFILMAGSAYYYVSGNA